MKPRIKTVTKKLAGGMKFISYEYKGKKYNTKGEVMRDISKGLFGRPLYLKYKNKKF